MGMLKYAPRTSILGYKSQSPTNQSRSGNITTARVCKHEFSQRASKYDLRTFVFSLETPRPQIPILTLYHAVLDKRTRGSCDRGATSLTLFSPLAFLVRDSDTFEGISKIPCGFVTQSRPDDRGADSVPVCSLCGRSSPRSAPCPRVE